MKFDDSGDHPDHKLMIHYNNLHKKLVGRCKIFIQKLYSGYHFKDKFRDNRTCVIRSVNSFVDHTDINNTDNDDNIGKDNDDLNKILNDLKDTIIEGLKN